MSPDPGLRPPAGSHEDREPGGQESSRAGDGLIAAFGLCVLLFSPMILRLFDRGMTAMVLGVPLLYFYVFAAWALVIALLAWAVAQDREGPPPYSGDGPR